MSLATVTIDLAEISTEALREALRDRAERSGGGLISEVARERHEARCPHTFDFLTCPDPLCREVRVYIGDTC